AERSRQMQSLAEELARAATVKDEMLVALDRVQGRQHDNASQIQAAEDQLLRAESMFKELDARRSQAALGEKKLAVVEARLTEIGQMVADVDKSIAAIADREQLVSAVKAEVEHIHQISARSRDDLAHVAEHRGELAALTEKVDLLLSRIAETDERVAAID